MLARAWLDRASRVQLAGLHRAQGDEYSESLFENAHKMGRLHAGERCRPRTPQRCHTALFGNPVREESNRRFKAGHQGQGTRHRVPTSPKAHNPAKRWRSRKARQRAAGLSRRKSAHTLHQAILRVVYLLSWMLFLWSGSPCGRIEVKSRLIAKVFLYPHSQLASNRLQSMQRKNRTIPTSPNA